MEKQIFIKHTSDDIDTIINDIVCYFDVIRVSALDAVCKFHLYKDQYSLLSKVKEFHDYKIVKAEFGNGIISCSERFDIELRVSYDELKVLLQMVVMNELNATVFCDSTKIVLNDNDGDFVIINTQNPNYTSIKTLSLQA